jgi:hypothetical protein
VTVDMVDPQTLLERRALLFSPQPRLGWLFRDRWSFRTPFTDPPPVPQPLPEHLHRRVAETEQLFRARLRRAFAYSMGAFLFLALVAACSASDYALGQTSAPFILFVLGLIAAAPGSALTGLAMLQRNNARDALAAAHRESAQAYEGQSYDWHARRQAHEAAEHARLNALPEWGAVPRPASVRRLDVYGGTLWSWEALVSTYGTSTLAEQPLLVIDLSREIVCRELAHLAEAAGVFVDAQMLPTQLASSTLLSGLDTQDLVDAVVESMHGGTPDAARAERSMDSRILSKICDALTHDHGDEDAAATSPTPGAASGVTLGRIAAALRALMGEPDDTDLLTRDERRRITNELFSVEYRRQAHANMSRIESYIHPLEALGTEPDEHRDAGYLTCIALDSQARNVRSELLTDLLVQWVTHRVAASTDPRPAVLIVGADELARRHLERLSDACERRGVPLTVLFRRLRETSLEMLGGGAACFMRLGNHEDASRAADFIGRDYRFVLSQITKNVGGNESHTRTGTYGEAEGDTITVSQSAGTSTNWGNTRSSGTTYSGGGAFGLFPDRSTSRGTSHSRGGGTSHTDTTGQATSTTRNWSSAYAYAEGTNWSDADTTQRVYEYAVEPVALQHLPDHALLLVESAPGGGRKLSPVECDPAIVTLDRVATGPLPEPPPPSHAIAAEGAPASSPQWVVAPPAVEPPRTQLPYTPGPPPGQHTGPRPGEQRQPPPGYGPPPTQSPPRPQRPDDQPPQQPPSPRPPRPRRSPPPASPPRGGPPPLFGRPEE